MIISAHFDGVAAPLTAIASAIFLAKGVDQSRVEDDEHLMLEDIP